MQAPWSPWLNYRLLQQKPTVGWLMELCEENYRRLLLLAPDIRAMEGSFLSSPDGVMDLHLEIQEQTPYTSLVRLTYFFDHTDGHAADPDVTLRLYYDASQAEVVRLEQRSLPLNRGEVLPTLEQKWDVNLFLSKWLAYCREQGHRFDIEHPATARPTREKIMTSG